MCRWPTLFAGPTGRLSGVRSESDLGEQVSDAGDVQPGGGRLRCGLVLAARPFVHRV